MNTFFEQSKLKVICKIQGIVGVRTIIILQYSSLNALDCALSLERVGSLITSGLFFGN